MDNFTFYNPVKIIFGKNTISTLSDNIDKNAKILLTYGGGSIKKNGVYTQVINALKGYDIIEFGGIESNPDYSTLSKAINICKEQNITFLLAVGGGSVIDGTKFIAMGAKYDGDAWDLLIDKYKPTDALPIGTVLTLPATSSEMNNGGVISRRETQEKYAFGSNYTFPKFSIIDPTVVYSLPKRQISNGIADIFAHVFEQYLTTNENTMLMDSWAEGILKTLISLAPDLLKDNLSYDLCANYMMCGTTGLNGFIAMGVKEDWATHMIGHELTALHGLDHGVTLAIVFPGTMSIMRDEKHYKLLKYAHNVLGITSGSDSEIIDKAIMKTESFFNSIGIKTRLSDYGISEGTIDTIVERFNNRKWNLGESGKVTPDKVNDILHAVL